ncbi:DeoR/GlpR family DNA-binding transcription regulator [Kocuria sp. M1R5S2]|uniref:DeoR/GlpR family DNA-binding transcription regulator n=1 Tax=Kocuria rhizosphaerae TaxID=3376285 RepID=UPI0037ADB2A7
MSEMLPDRRRREILDRVRAAGAVRVADLVAELGVSDMTVRRDLDRLARDRELQKVHGGAKLPAGSSAAEPGFTHKSELQLPEKAAIAAAAAAMVEPGMSVSLNSGTTTCALARALRRIRDITVVTNSPRIADVLHDAPATGQAVVSLGGVRTPSDALVGPLATAALRTLHLDLCFMGVHGISEREGLTTPNMMEAEVNRLFLDRCDRSVVLADSTKWGLAGLYRIAGLDEVDAVVMDDGVDGPARETLNPSVPDLRLEPAR